MSKTQKHLCSESHRKVNDDLQFHYWMCGKMPDSEGQINTNPLTTQEIRDIANSDKVYARTYQTILNGVRK